jgi:hypothetical protein
MQKKKFLDNEKTKIDVVPVSASQGDLPEVVPVSSCDETVILSNATAIPEQKKEKKESSHKNPLVLSGKEEMRKLRAEKDEKKFRPLERPAEHVKRETKEANPEVNNSSASLSTWKFASPDGRRRTQTRKLYTLPPQKKAATPVPSIPVSSSSTFKKVYHTIIGGRKAYKAVVKNGERIWKTVLSDSWRWPQYILFLIILLSMFFMLFLLFLYCADIE